MKTTKTALLSAAVSGLLLGATATTLSSCGKEGTTTITPANTAPAVSTDKHACKGRNDCSGKGGCKTGDNGCAGKNSCKGKGGCAVPVKH